MMFNNDVRISIHVHARRFVIAGFVVFFFCVSQAFAGGHKIKGTITGFTGDVAYLTMLYGGNQYVVDTAAVANGTFLFESAYHLQSGVYMVVLPPANSLLILIDQDNPEFSFQADIKNIESTIRFEGTTDNTVYYDYVRFFQDKKSYLDKVKKDYDSQAGEPDRAELIAKMEQLKKEIVNYQSELVVKHPGTLTAAMIQCELPVETPIFDGSPEEMQMKKYFFQKSHYFDHANLADERLIRAPKNVLVDKVDYYLDHLTVQRPDSIIASVDYILDLSEEVPVSYRFFLTHMFNKYRESKNIGMDAVYVHIAENYIAVGKAPWIEEEEKNNVLSAVNLISPTLIGKKAPNFGVQLEDGKDISLYDIESPFTVLVFWSPNCAHCKESMPLLNKFSTTYKDKGVQVFTVCTKLNEQEKNCWEYLDKNHFTGWINSSDKMGGSSSIHKLYNITTTPKIYVLAKDKTIIAKDLGVEHLEEVMKRVIQ